MKADASMTMPTSSFKTSVPCLRLSLQDVKESGDEEDVEEGGRPGPSKNGHSVSLNWSHSSAELNGELAEKPQVTKLKLRSQSAKRAPQNGHGTGRSDSPSSPGKNGSSPHRPAPPKSAPNLRPRKLSRNRSVKSRDQNGTQDSAEVPASPASPSRGPAARSETSSPGQRFSTRQPRRRLTSRSEELSSSSGDPQSPRLSVSDHYYQQQQQQLSASGTLSSSDGGSDDLRALATVPGSPGPGRGGPPSPTSKAWEVFEEHVRTIHDSSDLYSRYQGPSFQASSTFQETMVELYGHPDYTRPPGISVHNVAARGMMVAGAATRFLRLRKPLTVNGVEGAVRGVADKQTLENAKRGWRVLKQFVQDNYTSKRTSQAALSWSMLRHTLKGLSDREKSRVDLYRRYGIIPTVDPEGRLVMVNTMLSERARQAIASGSRHPHLAHGNKAHEPRTLTLSALPPALSSSSLSPRSSADSSGSQRRSWSTGIHSARSEVRTSLNGVKFNGSGSSSGGSNGGHASLRNGNVRRSAEFVTRSHTP